MIKILDQTTDSCLVVHFSDKVTGIEYQKFLDALAERLKTGSQVNLVIELVDFDFYGDFDSVKKDFKFGFGDYRHVHRAALVGNNKWIEWFTRFMGPFTRAEEKHFPADQFETALLWANG